MTTAPSTLTPATSRERLASVPAAVWLTGLVAVSFAVRIAAAAAHVAPRLFPDEYIYAALGRSLAEGSLTIRGEPAGFPALLEPLAAAPLWLVAGDDLELGYRLVQGMHALAVSLVAVPVYVIARRVGLSAAASLAAAALTLALPVLAWAPAVMADTFALPLALGAIAAGTVALERPGWRPQLLFLLLAGLACGARVQYVVLPPAFLLGALIARERGVRAALRDVRLTLVVLAAGGVAALLAGPGRVLGYYRSVTDLSLDAQAIVRWLGTDALLGAYAAGIVLVPFALVGLALGLARPATRAERAFCSIAAPFTVLIALEAGVYAANGAERFQERYLAAVVALVPVLALLGLRRLELRAARVGVAAVAGVLLLLAVTVPLSGYAALTGKQDSPTLWAYAELEARFGSGDAALLVATVAAGLAAAAALVAWRPRPWLAVALAGVVLVGAGGLAVRYDATTSERTQLSFGDHDQSWVDHARLGDVAVLQTPFSSRVQISSQLFWNRSLTRIARMEDASEVDAYGSLAATVGPRGTIRAGGDALTGPLLVEEYASWAQLEDARLVRRTINAALWDADGEPRLALLLAGRYFDGLLGARSSLTVWAGAEGRRTGTILLPLSLPEGVPSAELVVTGPGIDRVVTVPPGGTTLRVPFTTTGAFRVELRALRPFSASGGRLVAAFAGTPRIVGAGGESSK